MGIVALYTDEGRHIHKEGEDILFDHARYHELMKTVTVEGLYSSWIFTGDCDTLLHTYHSHR